MKHGRQRHPAVNGPRAADESSVVRAASQRTGVSGKRRGWAAELPRRSCGNKRVASQRDSGVRPPTASEQQDKKVQRPDSFFSSKHATMSNSASRFCVGLFLFLPPAYHLFLKVTEAKQQFASFSLQKELHLTLSAKIRTPL